MQKRPDDIETANFCCTERSTTSKQRVCFTPKFDDVETVNLIDFGKFWGVKVFPLKNVRAQIFSLDKFSGPKFLTQILGLKIFQI